MPDFILNQILFYLSIVFILFLPGYFLLLVLFASRTHNYLPAVLRRKAGAANVGHTNALEPLEKFIVIPGLSIISVDFIFFLYSRLDIPITQTSIILGISAFILVCIGICRILGHRISKCIRTSDVPEQKLFSFSKNQFILILLLIFLTLVIKTSYLAQSVAPTATDMGHHMYWAKWMAENHALPDYEGMPDFIIGEHTIFGAINLLSGASFFSAFPAVILYLINILGILTVFILTLRIFKSKTVAIFSLLFLGVLFAISSPQVKFVSGGVIGNVLGNYLMPLAFYFYYRAFEFLDVGVQFIEPEKSKELDKSSPYNKSLRDSRRFLPLAIFTTFGLFYTHHLTSFIFLFVIALLVPLFILINYKNLKELWKQVYPIIFSPQVIGTFVLGVVFFFFIFTPTYVNPKAVDTAVGTAVKSTRTGLTLENIKATVGESRFALGILGLILMALIYLPPHQFSKNINIFKTQKTSPALDKNWCGGVGYLLVTAWTIMLFVMSIKPHWLFVDIPSARIGNYLSYPLAILSAFSVRTLFNKAQNSLPRNVLTVFFFLLVSFFLSSGLRDSALAMKSQADFSQLTEVFHSSDYLRQNISEKDIVLKDHNYLTGDSWIKLFFMKEYKYPLSRGYFKRYEDPTNPREMCTLHMISNPGSADAEKCFFETSTNFVMLNPRYDSAQFQKLADFNQVYMGEEVAVYYRK